MMKLSTCFCDESFIYCNYARRWTSQTRLVSLSRTHSPLLSYEKNCFSRKEIYDRKKLFNNCHRRSFLPFLVVTGCDYLAFSKVRS